MESRIQEFKDFHGITDNLDNQEFQLDDRLSVKYNDEWIPLTKKNDSFYSKTTLKKYGTDFLRTVGLMPPKNPRPTYQAPSMNDLRNEVLEEYEQSKSLDFKQTPFTIGNFLKGYEMNVPMNHTTEQDPRVFLQEVMDALL